MVYLAVLGAALARDYFLRYQARLEETTRLQSRAARLEAQLAEARLDALRTQLNPHFLFNTLNAVSTLVERDPRGVRRMIARLGELLRHTLDEKNEQEITLERELDLLRRYLDIMEVRFQGRLSVTLDVADDVRDARRTLRRCDGESVREPDDRNGEQRPDRVFDERQRQHGRGDFRALRNPRIDEATGGVQASEKNPEQDDRRQLGWSQRNSLPSMRWFVQFRTSRCSW
jgi:hypothetical protein